LATSAFYPEVSDLWYAFTGVINTCICKFEEQSLFMTSNIKLPCHFPANMGRKYYVTSEYYAKKHDT